MTYTDLLGVRFRPHGRSKEQGYDCYGLVIEVLKRNGIEIPDIYYSSLKEKEDKWNEFNSYFTKVEKPEVNCVVEISSFSQKRGHMAVYIGDGLIIHSLIKTGVVIEKLSHYEHKIEGYYVANNQFIQKRVCNSTENNKC